jgi:F-type H+-transporting ATPase subunit b
MLAVVLAGSILATPEFWSAAAFFLFLGLLVYYRLPSLAAKWLDDRAEAIRRELDEARRLRDEAQQLLADYQRKSREAAEEADAIVEQARLEAEGLAAETRRNIKQSLERRTKLAEEKIARAEVQALSEVRAAAVDAAIAAAERILKTKISGTVGNRLLDQSIHDLRGKLR